MGEGGIYKLGGECCDMWGGKSERGRVVRGGVRMWKYGGKVCGVIYDGRVVCLERVGGGVELGEGVFRKFCTWKYIVNENG